MKRSVPKYIQNGCVTKLSDVTAANTELSSSRYADDERLDLLRCKKGRTLSVLMRTEPFELALDGRRG